MNRQMDRKKKICFVVQRYGQEVNGGAELLTKQYAEKLLPFYDVDVATSCAKDYITWKNEYKPGVEKISGVTVHRFYTEKTRDVECFTKITGEFYSRDFNNLEQCADWLKQNGPICPGLNKFIIDNRDNYEVFLFMGYLYYSTTTCMLNVLHKSILIPTAHDETPIHACDYYAVQYLLPKAFIFLTEEEKKFVQKKFSNAHIPFAITGAGVDLPDEKEIEQVPFKKEYNIKGDYIVYVGRIDSGKGCNELLEYFDAYKKKYRENLNLVLVGKGVMPVPKREDIIELGFVSDLVKFAAIANAKALVLPSRQESLGIVVLEAMALGVPVLLNAHCAVLKAQAEKSDAGLYFYNQEDFIAAMRLIIERKDISERFGENGKKFVEKHYKWDVIIAKICDLVEKVCADE